MPDNKKFYLKESKELKMTFHKLIKFKSNLYAFMDSNGAIIVKGPIEKMKSFKKDDDLIKFYYIERYKDFNGMLNEIIFIEDNVYLIRDGKIKLFKYDGEKFVMEKILEVQDIVHMKTLEYKIEKYSTTSFLLSSKKSYFLQNFENIPLHRNSTNCIVQIRFY